MVDTAKPAAMWIRDGVLVDRMHINPVAFAFAVWAFSSIDMRMSNTLRLLINYGFEKSGYSAAEKMRMYNQERAPIVDDVDKAAAYYNVLAAEAGKHADYFPGACDLLKDLQQNGIANFITSAVEQGVLDTWAKGSQGKAVAPYISEILGKRPTFAKGRDHFRYVAETLHHKPIYMVADAASEMKTARQLSAKFNIIPIGFANVITRQRLLEAIAILVDVHNDQAAAHHAQPISAAQAQVDAADLCPGTRAEVEADLKAAGAEHIVGGSSTEIIANLRQQFVSLGILTAAAV